MNKFLDKEKLIAKIEKALIIKNEKSKTIECQVTLKNYDYNKDYRFDSNCLLPFKKREHERILVVADKNMKQVCEDANLDFVMMEDVQGTTKDKKKKKKKLCKKYHTFIGTPTYNRAFEIKMLASRNKPMFTVRTPQEIISKHKELHQTVKFKLRKSHNINFPVGYTEMSKEDIAENISVALNHLFGLLKKGIHNVSSIYIKNTQGPSVRVL